MANSIFLFPGGISISGGGTIIIPPGGQVLLDDGSQTLPALSFVNDPDTGFYRDTANIINWTASGSARGRLSTSEVKLSSAIGIGWSPTSNVNTASDATITRGGAAIIILGDAPTPTDFGRLCFGPATAAFPALRKSSLTGQPSIDARLADNTGGADLGALNFIMNAKGRIGAPTTDGVVLISNLAQTDFGRLQFGGATASFPSLKRSTTALITRLADDSADAIHQCLRISTSSAAPCIASRTTLTDGAGVATGTLTNAPAAGNPTKWIAIDDNGTTRQIPCW